MRKKKKKEWLPAGKPSGCRRKKGRRSFTPSEKGDVSGEELLYGGDLRRRGETVAVSPQRREYYPFSVRIGGRSLFPGEADKRAYVLALNRQEGVLGKRRWERPSHRGKGGSLGNETWLDLVVSKTRTRKESQLISRENRARPKGLVLQGRGPRSLSQIGKRKGEILLLTSAR